MVHPPFGRTRPGLLVLLLLLVASPSFGLDARKSLSQYRLDFWRSDQGLLQSSARALLQTRDGYLWLGTDEGLVRFDGVRFVLFDRTNTPAIPQNGITALAEDAAGRLWIGMNSGGLTSLHAGVFTNNLKADGLPDERVMALAAARDGSLWIGTRRGLSHLANGRFTHFTTSDGLPDDRVWSIHEDRHGAIWVGTEGGIGRLLDGEIIKFTIAEGLSQSWVNRLAEDAAGTIWAGTSGGGLHRLRDGRFERLAGLPDPYITALYVDRADSLWIGTASGGVVRVSRGRIDRITAREGLTVDHIGAIAGNREGGLWIGTIGGGLGRLADGVFTTYAREEGLSADVATALLEGADGSIWIGTQAGGLNRYKDGAMSVHSPTQALGGATVRTLFQGRDGTLWVGARGGGATGFRDHGVVTYTTRNGLPSNAVSVIFEDRDGALWIGTDDAGLARIEDGRVTVYDTGRGLFDNSVLCITQTRDGSIWIGTWGGLNRLANGRLERYTTADGLPHTIVAALHEDAGGTLWVGTNGGGLARFAHGRFTSVSTVHGLFDDGIFTLVEDALGNFWMTCNRGIFRVARSQLEDAAAGRLDRVTPVVYGTTDGLKDREGVGGANSALRTRDGRLWFTTIKGAAVVDPGNMPRNGLPPPVIVEALTVDDNRATGRTPAIEPGHDRFEIQYTALSFLDPAGVHFKYRLEGFDRDWVDAGTRRTAYYTRLPHGAYTFRVIAANNHGVWNTEGAALSFVVQPHLYETRLFMLLAAGVLVATAASVYLGRIRQLRRRERHLVGVVEARTRDLVEAKSRTEDALAQAEAASLAKTLFLSTMSHELRTPLNAILGFAEIMQRGASRDDPDRERLRIIQESGAHLLGLINDILSISRIEAGDTPVHSHVFDLRRALEVVRELIVPLADAKGLAVSVDVAADLPSWVKGDAGKLRQVLMNLAGNAVKFTDAGVVTVRATWRDGRAFFVVEDPGRGISAAEQASIFEPFVQAQGGRDAGEGAGLGLAISRRYVRLMGGDLGLVSAPGQGTRFHFDIELPRAEPPVLTTPSVQRVEPGQRRPRILVVDDVEENRRVLSELHASAGLEVREAASGAAAVAVWRTDRPDLIWMDIRMKGLDGAAATRAIRVEESEAGDAPGGRTTIIAVTASVFEHEREQLIGEGFDDVVAKPFSAAIIFGKLSEHLGLRFLDAPAPGAVVRRPEIGCGRPVLVVDDHPVNQAVIVAMVEQCGCLADVVSNGRDAVVAVLNGGYALVLMDDDLPGMSGCAATAEIRRQEPPSRRTPVVALTGRTSDEQRERCLAAGMDDYVVKPVGADQIGALVRHWVLACVDDATLAGLRAMGAVAFHRIVDLYLQSTPCEIKALGDALTAGDGEGYRRAAHGLKGASSLVGAHRLARLCDEIPAQDSRQADGSWISIRQMEEEFARVAMALGTVSTSR